MIIVPSFAGKTVAVLGLGKSGLSAALALQAGGARVTAWDDNAETRKNAASNGISVVDLIDLDWHECVGLVLSPGIPFTFPVPHPVVQLARSHDCEIFGDVDLLYRTKSGAHFIGVTGTNGKSTTTTLLGHIFSESGMEAAIGGNLGTPSLDLTPLDEGGTYVLELSSYQLDLCPTIALDIAILLNISPDHLDRHGGLAGYIAAKCQIFHNQSSQQVAVIGVDDDATVLIYEDLDATKNQKVVPISGCRITPGGIYVLDGMLTDDLHGDPIKVMDMREALTLSGEHNHQNAAAAYAVARLSGLASDAIAGAIIGYPGLVHRQERLDQIDGVLFINDSKATNPDAASKALRTYQNIYWIAGGRAKDGGFEVLTPHLGNVRHAYLVGEAADQFEQAFGQQIPCHISENIQSATQQAHDQAVHDQVPNAVVLFSPACASFDQFPSFEARGDFFKQCVVALDRVSAAEPLTGGGRA